jgi:putative tryptophan/tyrosine transport system substrate-binding protein
MSIFSVLGDVLRRREFITLLGGAVAWPLNARAQHSPQRVGILIVGATAPSRDFELVHQLARLGYIEGRNITFEVRGADGDINRLPELARELTATNPDVIVASTSPAALALTAATRDIPIVMTVVGDPIALELSNSISHPSRNITGFTNSSVSLAAKRLELLREVVPALNKVAYLWVPLNPLTKLFGEQVRTAAEALGIKLVSLPLTSSADISAAFTLAEKEKVAAVLVESDELAVRFSGTIVDECLVRNLPAMHAWPFEVRNGALISYGPAVVENYPQTAVYVDHLLKGAKIAELPFEEPKQIRLAINLRTARSIGITVPPMLLARADEVIE